MDVGNYDIDGTLSLSHSLFLEEAYHNCSLPIILEESVNTQCNPDNQATTIPGNKLDNALLLSSRIVKKSKDFDDPVSITTAGISNTSRTNGNVTPPFVSQN